MSEHPEVEIHEVASVHPNRRRTFLTMIFSSILISLFLVYVAISLYQSSGTLQLDLSRPGYDSARQEATKDTEVFRGFSADGKINAAALTEFDKLYREKATEALIDIDAFSGDALSDQALTLDRD